MKLTFVTEPGETFVVEIDENMELENAMTLLEAKVGSVHTHTLAAIRVVILVSYETQLIIQSHLAFPTTSFRPWPRTILSKRMVVMRRSLYWS